MPQRAEGPRASAYKEVQRGLTRNVWRFEGQKYRTDSYEDPDLAYADAVGQLTQQMKGT